MRIKVKVIPNAKKSEIFGEGSSLRVRLAAPATEGKANSLLVKLLADHFNVKKSKIRIVSGHKSREKTVDVADQ